MAVTRYVRKSNLHCITQYNDPEKQCNGDRLTINSTLTDKWQTAIPAEVRKALRLKPQQRLIYELVDGAVLMRPQVETLKNLYGCLADGKPSASKGEERETARQARAVRYE